MQGQDMFGSSKEVASDLYRRDVACIILIKGL